MGLLQVDDPRFEDTSRHLRARRLPGLAVRALIVLAAGLALAIPIARAEGQSIEGLNAKIESAKAEAEELLAEYRERLKEARVQAEEIIARARKAAEVNERESLEAARRQREELMAQTRRDIEAEKRRAIQEIRAEVADLTVLATEKVTRKVLTPDDQRRLVDEALAELDFSSLTREGA